MPIQEAAGATHTYRDLFLISFLILFFELACIRWFGSTVVYLTFFTNIVLLATFLGMSVGCLTASSRRDWTPTVIPLLVLAVVSAWFVWYLFTHVVPYRIDVGGQGSPQQVYFGTEYTGKNLSQFFVPIESLAALFFTLIALLFVGMGQVMGRAFVQAPDRLRAYTSNIGGSLVGIAAFGLASYFRTRPLTWFAIALVLWCCFLKRRTWIQISGLVIILGVVGFAGRYVSLWEALHPKVPPTHVMEWSPYYKILYTPQARLIETNNIGYQTMVPVNDAGPAYELLHLLNRDAGGKPFEDVLIIGAGSGNDVSAALGNGAKHVDIVEIDPAIFAIGRADHPNHPYADPRVTVHIDDGRSFLRKTTRKYDLIVYALVDSLVLHSGYSSIRLESFLFTRQAFDDIAARLKPNGVFAAYNFFRQGWIVGRIDKMATEEFGAPPLVISLPYEGSIEPKDPQNGITFVLASHNAPAMAAIARRVRAKAIVLDQPDATAEYGDQWFRPTTTRCARIRLAADCSCLGQHRGNRSSAVGRLAIPLSARSANTCAKPAQHGADRWTLAADSLLIRSGAAGSPELADVLSRRRLHAAGDQGRGAHGAPVWFHLAGQLGRILRHPGDDPGQQPVCSRLQAAKARGLSTYCCRLRCYLTFWFL